MELKGENRFTQPITRFVKFFFVVLVGVGRVFFFCVQKEFPQRTVLKNKVHENSTMVIILMICMVHFFSTHPNQSKN